MGHKYSTIYTHNTCANYNEHQWSNNILDISKQLGYSNCKLIKKYPGKFRCKICFHWMDDTPVIMLECKIKHRYHANCFLEKYQ